ncbi:ferrous iron transport protein B [Bacillus andreraoultii]|uniref:ferrous iron transport protein B n=1 Tax=Bacillus andreraoultii TaxID=1499685 RepID=UPI00053B4939|nr:ferrous iron transport protein B [Bacillus andreraoultii]
MMQIALLGNPNIGKTSLFNQLTGSYEYVGNWSGVTVEEKVGLLKNKKAYLVDLPGTYSLTPLSRDERVVTEFLLKNEFSSIVNIVDASQLQRNLHLTIELLEFEKPLMMGLNMIDVAQSHGLEIDEQMLADKLGVNVQPIIARTGKGCTRLMDKIIGQENKMGKSFQLYYGEGIEKGITILEELLDGKEVQLPSKRWLAIQFFAGNETVKTYLQKLTDSQTLEELFTSVEKETIKQAGHSVQDTIYEKRDEFIVALLRDVVSVIKDVPQTFTEKVDRFATNKYLGMPIFLVLLYLMFMITFNWIGTPLSDRFDAFLSGPFTGWLEGMLKHLGTSEFLYKLIIEGIVPGVGGVLVFVPQIFILFFFISVLEDSGYMARISLVMDRIMQSIGLNGKAFIPMVIGFGCNVPGIMSARTIEQPKERLITILLTPLMSCSARLPVYALFAGVFFKGNEALVVLSLYTLGVVLALVLAKLFSKTILKSEESLFVVELPPYRVPHIKTLAKSTWDKGKGFVKKAGTFIFGGTVVIWVLSVVGFGGFHVAMDDSLLASVGSFIAPIFAPLGFGTWQAAVALVTGFLAKESIVATMNIVYHTASAAYLQGMVANAYTALSAYSFLVFILLYIPCLATVATIKKETGSTKWTIFSMVYPFVIAYVISFTIYQVGKLIGLN